MSERALAPTLRIEPVTGRVLQRKCACGTHADAGTECEVCRRKRTEIQRRTAGHDGLTDIPSIVNEVLSESGHALGVATRAAFEARFGHDFRDVRVHRDTRAAESARSVNAQAYTVGRHIVFADGQFALSTPRGQSLLAHELTHVVQQRNGLAAREPGHADSPFEQEAERNARLFATHHPLRFEHTPLRLAKRDDGGTVTVGEPIGATDCKLTHHRAIAPAVQQSLTWLQSAVAALSAYLAAPTAPGNSRVRGGLERHFHSTSTEVARTLRDRLDLLRRDITQRGDPSNPDPQRRGAFTVECHDNTDETCQVANAYVRNDNMLVFCPIFFNSFDQDKRSTSIIHEMAHALLGLNITDRAYSYDRLLPHLNTAEALDNAESYALFVRELATGTTFTSTAPSDDIEDCPATTEQLARVALARAERWNRQANTVLRSTGNDDLLTTHLADASPATRSAATAKFRSMENRLRSSLRLVCSIKDCGTRTAYKKQAVNRRSAGARIGAAVGGAIGAVAGGILGAVFGGVGGAIGGGLLGGLVLAGIGALIGLGIGAAASSDAAIHLCPAWAAQAAENDRIESILAVAYEVYGNLSEADSRRYAALARAVHDRHYPAPAP